MPFDPAKCGTYKGVSQHNYYGTPMCGQCREAGRQYMAAYRAGRTSARARDNWLRKTRGQAMEQLAAEHPDSFARILARIRDTTPRP